MGKAATEFPRVTFAPRTERNEKKERTERGVSTFQAEEWRAAKALRGRKEQV